MTSCARIHITADDAAIDKGLDAGILELAKTGVLTGVAAFSNKELLEQIDKSKPSDVSLGIHFNLSSGKPISNPAKIPSLVTSEGSFHCPTPDKQEDIMSSLLTFEKTKISLFGEEEIFTESNEQLNLFVSVTGNLPMFSTVHHDFDEFFKINNALKMLIPSIPARRERVDRGEIAGVFFLFLDQRDDLNSAISKISQMIVSALKCSLSKEGIPSEIVCHPGYIKHNVGSFTAYKDGRHLELRAWKSNQVQLVFKKAIKNMFRWEFSDILFEEIK